VDQPPATAAKVKVIGPHRAGQYALYGVLDLRAVLLDAALGPAAAAPGPQPPVPGEALMVFWRRL
jgi:hypothetical protein